MGGTKPELKEQQVGIQGWHIGDQDVERGPGHPHLPPPVPSVSGHWWGQLLSVALTCSGCFENEVCVVRNISPAQGLGKRTLKRHMLMWKSTGLVPLTPCPLPEMLDRGTLGIFLVFPNRAQPP